MQNKMKEAEAVLVAVLVSRGAITEQRIVDAVYQFNIVYAFDDTEMQHLIDILAERFILVEEEEN